MRLLTLGGLTVYGHDGPLSGSAAQPRRLALLALVARAGQRGITRAKLLALLWPDADDAQARRVLNQALYALRRDLGSDQAINGAQELRLDGEIIWCDIVEFDRAIARGDAESAALYYEGPFLDGFRLPSAPEFERWADDERTAIEHRYHEAVEWLAREAEQSGAHERAVTWWRRRAAYDPLNARVSVAMMQALANAGDRSGALRQARIFEALINQELEMPADRAVIELAESLRREDPLTVRTASTPPVATSKEPHNEAPRTPHRQEDISIAVLPFADIGTAPDTEEHRRWRDGLVEEIISALATEPGMRVAARSASFAFGHSPDLKALRTALNVSLALEGSVRRSATDARVTVRLIDVATGHTVWLERAECPLDAPTMQDEIAARVAARVRVSIA